MTGRMDTIQRSGPLASARGWLQWQWHRFPQRLIALGLPPRVLGWYRLQHISPDKAGVQQKLAPQVAFANPLPENVTDRQALNPDAGWWGYAMRDVPDRTAGTTTLATFRDVRVMSFLDGPKRNFTPAIVDARHRAISLPQVRYRDGHAALMRTGPREIVVEDAVWFAERVYDNHSHWLTAHLPKLLLLRDQGLLGKTIMPRKRTPTMDASLDMIGIDPTQMLQYDVGTVLRVARLTVPITDRFDPRLLRPVREAFAGDKARPDNARVFISRAKAKGRKILNEEALWEVLEARGFDRVFMEDLSFAEQVALMQRCAIVVAPHGAGLTNMMFCPPGTDIVELADPTYPNPNFYALASAMDHRFWLLDAQAKGTGHALEKDLTVDIDAVADVVDRAGRLRDRI